MPLSVATLTPDIFLSVSSLSRGDTTSISRAQDWSPGMLPSRLANLEFSGDKWLAITHAHLHHEKGPCYLGQRFGPDSCDPVLLETGPSGSCSTALKPECDCGCLNTVLSPASSCVTLGQFLHLSVLLSVSVEQRQ